MNIDTRDGHYDIIEMDKAQNEETSEPYYSEIVHNDSSDSGCVMKPNISYSTLQITNNTISGHGQSLARVCTSCKSSVEISTASDTTEKQNQLSDYEDVH